ncbi:MAG: LysR family transcriptional regulator [Sandaracinaceae bacterium]
MDVSRLDLGLLRALGHLLEEKSVSRAAQKLGLSQPATSHALNRLRHAFGDPLLVRVGRAMERTPRGDALLLPVRRLLDDAARLFTIERDFDPATSERTITLVCPDAMIYVTPRLLSALAAAAPRVSLEVQVPGAVDGAELLTRGVADLAVAARPLDRPGLMQRSLGAVRFAVLARRGHPAIVKGRLDEAAWAAAAHVVVRTNDARESPVGLAMRAAGLSRRIGFHAPSFLAGPFVAARTDLLFHAPRTLALDLARQLDLEVHPLPVPCPDIPIALRWHERMDADRGHAFVRRLLADVVIDALAEEVPSPRRRSPQGRRRERD